MRYRGFEGAIAERVQTCNMVVFSFLPLIEEGWGFRAVLASPASSKLLRLLSLVRFGLIGYAGLFIYHTASCHRGLTVCLCRFRINQLRATLALPSCDVSHNRSQPWGIVDYRG